MKLHYLLDLPHKKILVFHCPGCKYSHPFHWPEWMWNGSMDQPTFSPSLLVNADGYHIRCHSIVQDGWIQFLGDCDHDLKNQKVEIPEWE